MFFMSIPAVVKEKIWLKNWSGNWSLLFASTYGDIYTKGLQKLVGVGIENFILVFEDGVSANYLCPEETKEICATFIKFIERDKNIAERWAEHVIRKSKEILAFTSSVNVSKIDGRSYFALFELCSSMTPENFAIKKVIDYLSPELFELYLPVFTEARKATEPIYNEVDRVLKLILSRAITDKLGERDQSVVTKEEFELYLESGVLPDKARLKERYAGSAIVYDVEGIPTVIEHSENPELLKYLETDKNAEKKKGQPAYKGRASGKVRLVLDLTKIRNFVPGEVLVTGMTRPEDFPLMEKAAAFVTDAGGMLSHAAIVARELKKPCIVGTKYATRVLKDGDSVEVDANKGTVRKI